MVRGAAWNDAVVDAIDADTALVACNGASVAMDATGSSVLPCAGGCCCCFSTSHAVSRPTRINATNVK